MNHLPVSWRGVWLLVAVAGLAAGCQSEPSPEPAAEPRSSDPLPGHIIALQPHDMMQDVALRPVFRWRLPSSLGSPMLLSFKLLEVGRVEDPRNPGSEPRSIAFASGLHDTSPTEIGPFNPPEGSIVTGEVRDMKQLKPDTWYRWTVRAIGESETAEGTFHFRTQSGGAAATPEAAPATAAEKPPTAMPWDFTP